MFVQLLDREKKFSHLATFGDCACLLWRGCSGVSNGVVGKELLDERVVAMDAVVASSNEGGVQGGSFPVLHKFMGLM